ncbi:unnamed protein product [Protopolystoma xenopodis]|uniref:Uncharacterized protein n=1 Tax=Protopolystoma xenopodis TaxID=117903 RepID=A0A448XQ82_9PLAT|nr:unnamed protein product [Protopolystoma xenopodis]
MLSVASQFWRLVPEGALTQHERRSCYDLAIGHFEKMAHDGVTKLVICSTPPNERVLLQLAFGLAMLEEAPSELYASGAGEQFPSGNHTGECVNWLLFESPFPAI